jgi:hypothetical protein
MWKRMKEAGRPVLKSALVKEDVASAGRGRESPPSPFSNLCRPHFPTPAVPMFQPLPFPFFDLRRPHFPTLIHITCVCLYIYICVCVDTYIKLIFIVTDTYIYIHIYLSLFIYLCAFIYIHIYIYIFICHYLSTMYLFI